MATLIGRTLGSYEVEAELGAGGMGEVLLARQTSLDRPAVLKKIKRELSGLPELVERFRREARAAAAIHHQNVVAVYDCFNVRGCEYIAQEFVDGVDLATVLARAGALPWRITAMICLEIARGLEEIHSLGTVHRDLKPQNILLGRRGEVKIGDFGLALEATGSALTQPGVMIGSPPYMPPEQMLGERVDARCDVFALGVVLYEMLSGCLPYPEPDEQDPDTESLLARMQRERYPRLRRVAPSAPRFLVRITKGCLRARAKNRIASATRIRRRLEDMLGGISPEDLRAELASWLWERQVFQTRANETVVRVMAPADQGLRPPRRRGWIAALAACLAAIATLLALDPHSNFIPSAADEAAKSAMALLQPISE